MSISPYFSDDGVINQLRSFFSLDEQWTIDFENALSTLEDFDEDYFTVKVKDRKFSIHKMLGVVEEIQ